MSVYLDKDINSTMLSLFIYLRIVVNLDINIQFCRCINSKLQIHRRRSNNIFKREICSCILEFIFCLEVYNNSFMETLIGRSLELAILCRHTITYRMFHTISPVIAPHNIPKIAQLMYLIIAKEVKYFQKNRHRLSQNVVPQFFPSLCDAS